MDDEKLILLVQERELLYNKYHPNYKNLEKKKAAWQEISKQLGFSDDICQKRWTCLRDRYTKEKRNENLPSGSGSVFKPKWQFLSALEFLAPHIVPRPMRSSTSFQMESQPSSPSIFSSSDSSSQESQPAIMDSSINLETTESTSKIYNAQHNSNKKRRKNSELTDVDALFQDAVEAFKKACDTSEKNPEYNDTIEGFGKMLLGIMSTMSPAKQMKTIQRVTTLIMEIQMEPE